MPLSSGGGVYPTMMADDFFRIGSGGLKPSASYPLSLGSESALPPTATERRAMTVDVCAAPRGDGGEGVAAETRSSSSSSLASLGRGGAGREPPLPGVGSPVGLLLHLARGSPSQRASAEAQLRAGIAVLRLRVVALVNLVSERDASLSSHLAAALRVTAAVAAREASEAQKGTPLNASSARLSPWPMAATLGVPALERPTAHVPVMQDFWLPVHDVSTQRLWIAAKVMQAVANHLFLAQRLWEEEARPPWRARVGTRVGGFVLGEPQARESAPPPSRWAQACKREPRPCQAWPLVRPAKAEHRLPPFPRSKRL